jgi:hypothetical protein
MPNRIDLDFGKYRIYQTSEFEKDWNRYSKSWHRQWGPVVTEVNRKIVVGKLLKKGSRKGYWINDSSIRYKAVEEIPVKTWHKKRDYKIMCNLIKKYIGNDILLYTNTKNQDLKWMIETILKEG